jgi:uncharacterized protein (DUF58 family)
MSELVSRGRAPALHGAKAGEPPSRSARLLRILRSSRALARLNHVFIPEKKPERDRLRRSLVGRLLQPVIAVGASFSREGRALLALSVLVGFAGLDIRDTQVHQLFAMLAGVLFASLLASPFFWLRGLELRVTGPDRVSVGSPARFDVELRNVRKRRLLSLRLSGPFLPWDGRWVRRIGGVAVLEPGSSAIVSAEARFIARGEHHLDAFDVAALVPLGLAVGPRRTSEGVRFLVVPRVAQVSPIALRHRTPDQRHAMLSSLRPGDSEIIGVRPYRPGDPIKHLHARTWARTGVPHVRQYVDERRDRVALAVLVDGGEVSERTKEAALSVAAGVAARLVHHEGGLDLLLLDDCGFGVVPRTGMRALDTVLDRLAVHTLVDEPRRVAEAFLERLGGVSSVVLVTAGLSERALAMHAEARERAVPIKLVVVRDPESELGEVPTEASVLELSDVEEGRKLSL